MEPKTRRTARTEDLIRPQNVPVSEILQTPMPIAPDEDALALVLDNSPTAPVDVYPFKPKANDPPSTVSKRSSFLQTLSDACTFLLMCIRAYGGMLVATGVLFPPAMAIVTLAAFLFLSPTPASNWTALLFGALFTYMGWMILSAFFAYFASAEGANSRSYYTLRSRLYELKARLGIIDGPDGRPLPMSQEEMQEAVGMQTEGNNIALREAYAAYTVLNDILLDSYTGIPWVLGTGYVNVWSMIHRAEEALIEVEPLESVIGGAMHDQNCIQESRIANRYELLERLSHAIKHLDPLALPYFSAQLVDRSRDALLSKVIHSTRQTSQRLNLLLQAFRKTDGQKDSLTPDELDEHVDTLANDVLGSPEVQKRARIALREVRTTLNEYRDSLWEGLVRARNRLLGSIFLLGLVTYGLLAIAIMTNSGDNNRQFILGALVYYLIGATAGIFGRFYKELTSPSSVDDYNLSLTRLIATPMLSGLAGIGGVLTATLFYNTLLGQHVAVLGQLGIEAIMRPAQSYYLLAAALFGLAPNLLIQLLQQKAEEYAASLRLSKSSELNEIR